VYVLYQNRLKKLIASRQNDAEFLQAISRVVFFISLSLILGFLYTSYLSYRAIQIALVLYTLFIIIHTFGIIKGYPPFMYRRLSAIVADLGMLSFLTYSAQLNAIILYPLIIWTVMGNGMRFGEKYFYIGLLTAVLFLTAAIEANPFWAQHNDLGIALIIGLILITIIHKRRLKQIQQIEKRFDTKFERKVGELVNEYHYDSLTGLKNRIALEKALENEPFSGLMIIDIDGFMNINELYGIHTGDQTLKKFAVNLQRFLQERNFELYRIYGDVFAAKAHLKFIDHDVYEQTVKDLLLFTESLQLSDETSDNTIKPDITIGISLQQEDALNKAEMALNFAKKHAKKYIAYSKMIDNSKNIHQLLQRKNEIKDAISNDNFIPVFQPILNRAQKIVKYEALIRMRKFTDGTEQLVAPHFFLHEAVKTKQYETLTLIMIEKSFRYMDALNRPFSINLSFNDILNDKVRNALKENIERYNITDHLTVEILEGENVDDYLVLRGFIKEFKKLGIEIAIDDFGSGFSNFTHVFELEPDILKIDASLIKNIDNDKKSYEFVKSIVQLAKALGIKTVAEFVHSKAIFEITYELGIDYFQGYYFYEPLPSEKLSEQVTN